MRQAKVSPALSLAHDAVIGRSSAGEITFWNRGAEECYGWTAAEAVGRSAWELLPGRNRPGRQPTASVLLVDVGRT